MTFKLPPTIERIVWDFTAYNSGDLEASTKTITATSKPGTPDYTYNISAGAARLVPPDARFIPQRFCGDIELTIDSMTAAQLNCAVHVDGVQVGANLTWAGAGANQRNQDDSTNSAHLDGVTTVELYFWVDAGNAVLSLVTLRYGYGTSLGYPSKEIMRIGPFTGWMSIACNLENSGVTGAYIIATLSPTILMGIPNIRKGPGSTIGFGHGESGPILIDGYLYIWQQVTTGLGDGFTYLNAIEIMYQRA